MKSLTTLWSQHTVDGSKLDDVRYQAPARQYPITLFKYALRSTGESFTNTSPCLGRRIYEVTGHPLVSAYLEG